MSVDREVADVLMEHLPATGCSEPATKVDFETYASAFKKDFEIFESGLRTEIANLHTELVDTMSSQTRTFMASQIVLVLAVIGSVTGAVATLAH